jgi:hypothetical protein
VHFVGLTVVIGVWVVCNWFFYEETLNSRHIYWRAGSVVGRYMNDVARSTAKSSALTITLHNRANFAWGYTGCFRGYVPYFGRTSLRFNYIDITENTYIRRWTFTEIVTRQCVTFLRFHVLYLFNVMPYPYTAQVWPWADNEAKA